MAKTADMPVCVQLVNAHGLFMKHHHSKLVQRKQQDKGLSNQLDLLEI